MKWNITAFPRGLTPLLIPNNYTHKLPLKTVELSKVPKVNIKPIIFYNVSIANHSELQLGDWCWKTCKYSKKYKQQKKLNILCNSVLERFTADSIMLVKAAGLAFTMTYIIFSMDKIFPNTPTVYLHYFKNLDCILNLT